MASRSALPVILASLLVAALGLSGCGPRVFEADVTRFTTLADPIASPTSAAITGASFTILPIEGQRGSIEFQRYAEMVAARLQAEGMVPVAAAAGPADYVVFLDYGLGSANTEVWRTPGYPRTSVFGGLGPGGGWGSGVALNLPVYDTGTVQTYTTIPHYLSVTMAEGESWRAGQPVNVFEGRALANLTERALPDAMPYLATALFRGFPGRSGETIEVELPLPDR